MSLTSLGSTSVCWKLLPTRWPKSWLFSQLYCKKNSPGQVSGAVRVENIQELNPHSKLILKHPNHTRATYQSGVGALTNMGSQWPAALLHSCTGLQQLLAASFTQEEGKLKFSFSQLFLEKFLVDQTSTLARGTWSAWRICLVWSLQLYEKDL